MCGIALNSCLWSQPHPAGHSPQSASPGGPGEAGGADPRGSQKPLWGGWLGEGHSPLMSRFFPMPGDPHVEEGRVCPPGECPGRTGWRGRGAFPGGGTDSDGKGSAQAGKWVARDLGHSGGHMVLHRGHQEGTVRPPWDGSPAAWSAEPRVQISGRGEGVEVGGPARRGLGLR